MQNINVQHKVKMSLYQKKSKCNKEASNLAKEREAAMLKASLVSVKKTCQELQSILEEAALRLGDDRLIEFIKNLRPKNK
jgi:hypothetical protein